MQGGGRDVRKAKKFDAGVDAVGVDGWGQSIAAALYRGVLCHNAGGGEATPHGASSGFGGGPRLEGKNDIRVRLV